MNLNSVLTISRSKPLAISVGAACLLLTLAISAILFGGRRCTLRLTNVGDKPLSDVSIIFSTHTRAIPRIEPGESIYLPVTQAGYSAIQVRGSREQSTGNLLETGFQDAPGFALSSIDINIGNDELSSSTSYEHAWTWPLIKARTGRWLRTGQW